MSLPNTEENTGGKGQVKAKEKDPREERYWRVQKKQKLGEEGKREEKKRRRKRWNQKLFFIFFILLTLLGMDSAGLMSAVALPRLIWPKFSARDSWIKIWRRKTEKEKKKGWGGREVKEEGANLFLVPKSRSPGDRTESELRRVMEPVTSPAIAKYTEDFCDVASGLAVTFIWIQNSCK